MNSTKNITKISFKYYLVLTLLVDNGQKNGAKNPARFVRESLDEHNRLRRMHNTPPLQLNWTLTCLAQEWANHLANTRKFQHRPSSECGENLYMISSGSIDGKAPVRSWYDEIILYNFYNPKFSSETGHFTQVVWKSTKQMGTGFATDRCGRTYVVTNYYPAGNFHGKFQENVLRRKLRRN